MKWNPSDIRYWVVSIIFGITIFACFPTMAQSKLQAGPFWGQGLRMITGNEEADIGFGYHGGIVIRIPIDDQFSILPSLSVARKGYNKWEFGWWSEDFVVQYNQKLTYLDLYLPVKCKVAGVFNLQAGFQAGLLLEGDLIVDNYNYNGKYKLNIKNDLNQFDFGFVLGGGAQFKNGIGVDLILNQGITDVYKDESTSYIDPYSNYFSITELDGKNLLLTINVSYLFGYAPKPITK